MLEPTTPPIEVNRNAEDIHYILLPQDIIHVTLCNSSKKNIETFINVNYSRATKVITPGRTTVNIDKIKQLHKHPVISIELVPNLLSNRVVVFHLCKKKEIVVSIVNTEQEIPLLYKSVNNCAVMIPIFMKEMVRPEHGIILNSDMFCKSPNTKMDIS